MNKKVMVGLVVVLVGLVVAGLILSFKMPESLTAEEKQEITNLIENFGKKLISVDKVAPDDIVSQNIKEVYSPFLTDNLILEWTFDPAKALGRVCSSPWPDRIEILSIEKIDEYDVKVKGHVVWVASGGVNKLEVSEKVPIVLVLRKDSDPSSSQKFLIDRVYSNDYAFYNGKALLKTLKEAFKGMYYIGERYEPFPEREVYFTQGTSHISGAIVDMGTGGAYVEYYTICVPTNGYLEVANFKDKDGNIAPLFFDEGASVKHEAKLSTFDDGKGNNILYQSVVQRNDSGEVSDITVDAYRWNKSANLFEYSKEFSESIKKDLEEQLIPKTVSLSDLKFKEIKSKFPAIHSVSIYEGKVAFSCGSGKIKPNMPTSSNINNIIVYDIKSGKIEFSKEIGKNWLMIDDVQMNDNWILFRAIEDLAGVPVECFAINRETGELTKLLQNYKDYNDFIVSHILLQANYAHIALEKSENGNKITRLIRINLDNGAVQNYFEKESKPFKVSRLWPLRYDCIAFSAKEMAESGEIKQYVYRYSFTGRSSDSEILPDYIDSYALTPDEHIVYFKSGKIVVAPLRKPDDFEEIGLEIFNPSILLNDTATSDDYIVAKLDNGDIFVFNRKTKDRIIIKGLNETSEIVLNGSKLCVINHPESALDTIIYIDLKENGF